MIPIGDARRRFGFPWMTVFLLLLGGVVFLFERRLPLASSYALSPEGLDPAEPVFILTRALMVLFLQGPGWLEPLANLAFLWALGHKVEDACGPGGLLMIYLLSGIGGVAIKVLADPYGEAVYGLAGVVAGLFGAYFILYQMAPIRSWIPPLFLPRVPAFLLFIYWAGLEFINIDFAAARAMKWQQIVSLEPTWPFVGALFLGLLLGPLFARREYIYYQMIQARRSRP